MKSKIVVLILLSVVLTLSWSGPNKTLSSIASAKVLADKAMADAVKGNYRKAFSRFRPYWPLEKKEIDQVIIKIDGGMKLLQKRFGKSISYEFIERKNSKGFLMRYIYVQKFQNALVRWSFTYYKPGKHWHILGVSFDDNYEALLR